MTRAGLRSIPPVTAYVALGSNLGDRLANIASAIAALKSTLEIQVNKISRVFETAPVGPPGQVGGAYLNAAAELSTTLAANDLLATFLSIEAAHGRIRNAQQRWGPRQLDLDLLLYGNEIISQPGLHVPHPRMEERSFVLIPLAEIAPDVLHPVLGLRLQCLLERLETKPLENGT